MPTNYDKERAEECRHEVRHHLATCSTVARDVAAIRRAVNKYGNDYNDAEVLAALTFLANLDPAQVKVIPDELGGTNYYQITAAGTLADERS